MNTDLARAMLEGLYQNPFDPREWILLDKSGEPLSGVQLSQLNPSCWGPNNIHLHFVRAIRKGGGRALMELLVQRADELGATLTGDIKPMRAAAYGMKKMSKQALRKWYRQFGFKVYIDEITRLPR